VVYPRLFISLSLLIIDYETFIWKEFVRDTPGPSTPPPHPAEKMQEEAKAEGKAKSKSKGKAAERVMEDTGIRRYEIIGTHKFAHDDAELDRHLTHVLKWWHGERKPEGVSLEHSYRCS
jgi:hypothetical protein